MIERDLIGDLTKDLTPVRRLTSPSRAAFILTGLGLFICLALVAVLFGLRRTGPLPGEEISYVIAEFGALAMAVCLALAASRARVPGRSISGPFQAAAAILVLTSLALIAIAGSLPAPAEMRFGWPCSEKVILICLPVLALGFWFARRGAPVHPTVTGLGIAGIAVGVGACALPLVCESGESLHLLIAHLLIPLAIVSAVFGSIGARFLRW